MDKFKESRAISRVIVSERRIIIHSKCILYFYRGTNAFSLAKLNFVIHNIMLFLTYFFAETLFAIILSESKKCLLLLYPAIKSDGQEKSSKILISWQELKNRFLSFFVHTELLSR